MQEKKTAILVTSVGSSIAKAREKTIDAFENFIREKHTGCMVVQAFTSPAVIRILKERDHLHVYQVEEALDALKAKGVTDVYVQPTHIIHGMEYNKLSQTLAGQRHCFYSLKTGTPLLSTDEDLEQVISFLTDRYSRIPLDTAIVAMGHGTPHHVNFAYTAYEMLCRQKGLHNYFIGTAQGCPDFARTLESIKKAGFQKALLFPLMFTAGNHALHNMAGDNDDSWKSRLTASGIKVTCDLRGLGECPQIHELLWQHLVKALQCS